MTAPKEDTNRNLTAVIHPSKETEKGVLELTGDGLGEDFRPRWGPEIQG